MPWHHELIWNTKKTSMVCFFHQELNPKVEKLDEADLAQKVGCLKTHEATIECTLENFDQAYNRYKSMLG